MPNIAKPSVQSLLIQMQFNGQPLATGTAFVVDSSVGPLLITNRHNVTGINQQTNQPLSSTGGVPNELIIVHNRKGQLGQWVSRTEPLFAEDTPRWIEHPELGSKADFVALPLTAMDDVELYSYELSNPGPEVFIGPADTVSVVGFPFGITAGGAFAVWATGFLASEPIVDFQELPIQLIDCRSRQGQSGSPVIAYRNGGMVSRADGSSVVFSGPITRLIGVYSGRINSESDLGIVWKSSALKELVDWV